jgi:hypothetical protein
MSCACAGLEPNLAFWLVGLQRVKYPSKCRSRHTNRTCLKYRKSIQNCIEHWQYESHSLDDTFPPHPDQIYLEVNYVTSEPTKDT